MSSLAFWALSGFSGACGHSFRQWPNWKHLEHWFWSNWEPPHPPHPRPLPIMCPLHLPSAWSVLLPTCLLFVSSSVLSSSLPLCLYSHFICCFHQLAYGLSQSSLLFLQFFLYQCILGYIGHYYYLGISVCLESTCVYLGIKQPCIKYFW